MSSREEFAALLRADPESGFHPQQTTVVSPVSKASKKPPQAPLRNEQTPLLPPGVPPVSPRQPTARQLVLSDVPQPLPPSRQRHTRASSDFAPATLSDPSHPLIKNSAGLPPPHHNARRNKPPLRAVTVSSGAPGIPPPPPRETSPTKQSRMHRRIKSDIPKRVQFGGITKSDLLKNIIPDPRWGGPMKSMHARKRSASSSGELFEGHHIRSNSSGGFGYGSMAGGGNSAGNNAERHSMHVRTKSDASMASVTMDYAKSSLIKEITQEGRIRFQLPKDNFRILMDCSLEAGNVYKRKLLDDEDSLFVEFHTEDPTPSPDCPCHCTCDRCQRCSAKQKALPPDLFVMAVDANLYRKMMDEVIQSKTMPCGLFFCGHHEDVRYPDIKIAVAIVSLVFVLLFVGTEAFGGD